MIQYTEEIRTGEVVEYGQNGYYADVLVISFGENHTALVKILPDGELRTVSLDSLRPY